MCTRIGVAVSCAPASIGSPGAATINRPSRETVNSPASPGRELTAEQRDGAGAARSMPRRSRPERMERALSPFALRICFRPLASLSPRAPRMAGSMAPAASAASTRSAACLPHRRPARGHLRGSASRWRLRRAPCSALRPEQAHRCRPHDDRGRGGPGRIAWSLGIFKDALRHSDGDADTLAMTLAHIKGAKTYKHSVVAAANGWQSPLWAKTTATT